MKVPKIFPPFFRQTSVLPFFAPPPSLYLQCLPMGKCMHYYAGTMLPTHPKQRVGQSRMNIQILCPFAQSVVPWLQRSFLPRKKHTITDVRQHAKRSFSKVKSHVLLFFCTPVQQIALRAHEMPISLPYTSCEASSSCC